jgi:hypothetical protein
VHAVLDKRLALTKQLAGQEHDTRRAVANLSAGKGGEGA